jgi:hypothetical protein
MSGFSRSFAIIATLYAFPIFLNKGNNPLRIQMPNSLSYLLIFVDTCENLVMANDATTPLNPPVAPVEKEELEEALLDVNVS